VHLGGDCQVEHVEHVQKPDKHLDPEQVGRHHLQAETAVDPDGVQERGGGAIGQHIGLIGQVRAGLLRLEQGRQEALEQVEQVVQQHGALLHPPGLLSQQRLHPRGQQGG